MKDQTARIEVLERQHKELDKEIKIAYNKYSPSSVIENMKKQKLRIKDEITKLKESINGTS